jgi:hypothetical protein
MKKKVLYIDTNQSKMNLYNEGMDLYHNNAKREGFKKLVLFMDAYKEYDCYTSKCFQKLIYMIYRDIFPMDWLKEWKDKSEMASICLGYAYISRICEHKLRKEGLKILENLVKFENTYAIWCLGDYFAHPILNYEKAFELYYQGAKLGNSNCMVNIGHIYVDSLLNDEVYQEGDHEKANEWYFKAANRGNTNGMFYLAKSLQDDEKKLKWSKKGTELGNENCMEILGVIYCKQHRYREGIKLIRKSYELDGIYAYHRLETYLNMISPQNREEFCKMNNVIETPYIYPQTVEDMLKMEDEYNEKILLRKRCFNIMYTLYIKSMYIPKDLIDLMVHHL